MIQEILQKVEAAIHSQMEEKFGLTQEQSEKSVNAFRDELGKYMGNGFSLETIMENIQSLKDSEKMNVLRQNLADALEQKAGLSPEMAAKVRDLSMTELYQTVLSEITDENGHINVQKILSKINLGDFENTAKGLFDTINQRFGK